MLIMKRTIPLNALVSMFAARARSIAERALALLEAGGWSLAYIYNITCDQLHHLVILIFLFLG